MKKTLRQERFARLETSLQQALQHARGERYDLRTAVLPAPSPPLCTDRKRVLTFGGFRVSASPTTGWKSIDSTTPSLWRDARFCEFSAHLKSAIYGYDVSGYCMHVICGKRKILISRAVEP